MDSAPDPFRQSPPRGSHLAVAQMLALDGITLTVTAALQQRGIDVLLMKGPVTGRMLFDDPLAHLYTDVDLLVGEGDRDLAGSVLLDVGFHDFHRSVLSIYRPHQQRAWISEAGVVDLHSGLWGIPDRMTETAWRTIWAEREELILHGRPVPIIGARARLVQLALHAAQRQSGAKAVADLQRGLLVASQEDWQSAADLATECDATAVFAAGLRRAPGGDALLTTLIVDTRQTTKSILHSRGASPEAVAIEHLMGLPPCARWRAVSTWLAVDPTRASRRSLALDRVKALLLLPRGFGQWWRARRESRAGQ